MDLSPTVYKIDGDFSRKLQKKSHPGVFCPTLTGSAWIWVSTQGSEKNGMMGLLDGPKSFKIGLAI